MFIAGFVIGMVLGGLAGVFTICMVIAGKRADEQREYLLSGKGQSRKKIRFVDGNAQEFFSILDGEYIQMTAGDGERQISRCHYEDRNHVRIDGQLWQLQEFAKQMEMQGIFYTPMSG